MIDVSLSQSFLNPKSVAIIGASADPKKTGSRAQRFLVSHGYKGKIFPVNPNREEIFGLKCYPNLKSINEQVDHIFVAIDGNKIIEYIKDAISIKVRCATILSGGFSESGSEGNNLEKHIFKIDAFLPAGLILSCSQIHIRRNYKFPLVYFLRSIHHISVYYLFCWYNSVLPPF